MAVTEGSVERNPNGKLEAHIEALVPFQSLQRLNEKLSLHTIQVTSEDTTLSNDGSIQTFFSGET